MLLKVIDWRASLALCVALSFALTIPSKAQSTSNSNRMGLAAFDATRAVTLQGTIKEVISHPPAGTLMGSHLLVATTTGTQDVHIGPYVSKSGAGNSLRPNASVIAVGSFVNLNGKQLFLASHLVINGQTIKVRNQNGFLIHPAAHAQHRASKTSVAGGAQ